MNDTIDVVRMSAYKGSGKNIFYEIQAKCSIQQLAGRLGGVTYL